MPRGKDKKKRSYAGGRQKLPDHLKIKNFPVYLTDAENLELVEKFGTRTKAIKTLLNAGI